MAAPEPEPSLLSAYEPPVQAVETHSLPSFAWGVCRCGRAVVFPRDVPFDHDAMIRCDGCGSNTKRLALIRGALVRLDSEPWGALGADVVITGFGNTAADRALSFRVQAPVRKWLHYDVGASTTSGVQVGAYLDVSNPTYPRVIGFGRDDEDPVSAVWFRRFGIRDSVPAWRQSLYAAWSLRETYPAAAVVLLAAGFEAFFIDTMRIRWIEDGRDEAAFDKAARASIASLVLWLPEAVGCPSFRTSRYHERWSRLVNKRRNDIVHRARIELSLDDFIESLTVTIDSILTIDHLALVHPHAYYLVPELPVGDDEDV